MCGIASITLSKTARTDHKLDDAAGALMNELKARGRDATGLMTISANGTVRVQKAAVDARDFNIDRTRVPNDTRALAVHTRFATQGDKGWMKNNHPVEAGTALVMHNGVVWDGWLKDRQGRPEVDSYALSVQANASAKRRDGESAIEHAKRIISAMGKVDGSAAVQVAFKGQPFLISARISSSPLCVCESEGVRVTASTVEAVRVAFKALELEMPTTMVDKEMTNKKGKKYTGKERVEAIWGFREGDLVSWYAGQHDEDTLPDLKAIESYTRPARSFKPNTSTHGAQSYYDYDRGRYAGGAGSYSSYPGQGSAIRWYVGEHVKITNTDRHGYIKQIESTNNKPSLYTIEIEKEGDKNGYTAVVAGSLLSRYYPAPNYTPALFDVDTEVTCTSMGSMWNGQKGIVKHVGDNTTHTVCFTKSSDGSTFEGIFARSALRKWWPSDESNLERQKAQKTSKTAPATGVVSVAVTPKEEVKKLAAPEREKSLPQRHSARVRRILGIGAEKREVFISPTDDDDLDWAEDDSEYRAIEQSIIADTEKCEICDTWSTDWEVHDDVTVCGDCSGKLSAWERGSDAASFWT